MKLQFKDPLEAAKFFAMRDKVDTQFSKSVHTIAIAGVKYFACIYNAHDFYAAKLNVHNEPEMLSVNVQTMVLAPDPIPVGIYWPLMLSLVQGFIPDVLLREWHRGQLGINLDMIALCVDSVQDYHTFCEKIALVGEQ